eukprot:TRINITY_DN7712_c1_g1_i1.p1 TRINITY_DN7712_c1_g1~~TRINITY_DN7712_c1_g1_i1.p1  ORF type:complete len:633 (-),score=97.88 TRINITY_DN7712_c1_g1_i1:114-2012(-)
MGDSLRREFHCLTIRGNLMNSIEHIEDTDDADTESMDQFQRAVNVVVGHNHFDNAVNFLIVGNVIMMCFEVNDLASSYVSNTTANPLYDQLGLGFGIIFTVEILLKLFVERMSFFRSKWSVIDVIIVMSSWVDFAINNVGVKLPSASLLRIVRVSRLSRAVRIMVRFPELYKMIRGFYSAMMAMFWGIVLIMLLLLVFAILSVELLYDKQKDIVYGDGTWCEEAFTSVFKVILMSFQNLVAGDSWGQCAVPVVMAYPPMFVVFAAALIFVQLGFTNLILSSIVESASASSQEDMRIMALEKQKEEEECLNRLYDMIRNIDVHKSGEITIEEFLDGYDADSDIRLLLRRLSIDRSDIAQLFHLMDNDQSGTVTYDEFMNCIKKAETQDMRVQMMVLKLLVSDIASSLKDEMNQIVRLIETKITTEVPTKVPAETRALLRKDTTETALNGANSGSTWTSTKAIFAPHTSDYHSDSAVTVNKGDDQACYISALDGCDLKEKQSDAVPHRDSMAQSNETDNDLSTHEDVCSTRDSARMCVEWHCTRNVSCETTSTFGQGICRSVQGSIPEKALPPSPSPQTPCVHRSTTSMSRSALPASTPCCSKLSASLDAFTPVPPHFILIKDLPSHCGVSTKL